MDLSNEDKLRLNVLLAQDTKAIRIDESKLIVYALTSKGNVKVQLNPTCKNDKYIRIVKELLSNKIMGSPGGYPVYIKRWTRMGQDRENGSLQQLLLLGEEEAIIAVVHAPALSAEIAGYAWWAYQSAENARRLLEKSNIVESQLARELTEFLLEFLPFESDHRAMIDSVRLCLQPELMTEQEVRSLWKKARRKQSLYVGFLHSMPDNLPIVVDANNSFDEVKSSLITLCRANNPYAVQLIRYLEPKGQAFLKTVHQVLDKAASQDTIVSMFLAIEKYNDDLPIANLKTRSIKEAESRTDLALQNRLEPELCELLDIATNIKNKVRAMLVIAQLGEITLNPIFGLTDALGSVMRKKLKPLTEPLNHHIDCLLK